MARQRRCYETTGYVHLQKKNGDDVLGKVWPDPREPEGEIGKLIAPLEAVDKPLSGLIVEPIVSDGSAGKESNGLGGEGTPSEGIGNDGAKDGVVKPEPGSGLDDVGGGETVPP